jgi:proton-translocating NADH-quinone oxidoreductase chain M
MIKIIIILPILNIITILLLKKIEEKKYNINKNIKKIGEKRKDIIKIISIIPFIVSLYWWCLMEEEFKSLKRIGNIFYIENIYNTEIRLGIDGLSIGFIIITNLLIYICINISFKENNKFNELLIVIYILQIILNILWTILDILLYYIVFELILIPVFLLIGIWGKRGVKVIAAYKLYVYTLITSIPMLLGIIYIKLKIGSTGYFEIMEVISKNCTKEERVILYTLFFITMSVKIPIVPIHIWLPEAHVEAPVIGSIILGGLMLKLGVYGILRFIYAIFPIKEIGITKYITIIFIISLFIIIYILYSIDDIKKFIAYSSIIHMNISLVGIMLNSGYGIIGGIISLLSHSLISAGMFLCVAVMYEKLHTYNMLEYNYITVIGDKYKIIFLLYILCNFSFPGTMGFIGEVLILMGILEEKKYTKIYIIILLIVMFIIGIISIWYYTVIFYVNIDRKKKVEIIVEDRKKGILKDELVALNIMLIIIIILGLYTKYLNSRILELVIEKISIQLIV